MKHQLSKFLVPVISTLGFVPVLPGTSVNEQLVPANVEWLLHIDADTLRASQSGGALIRELQALSPLKDNPDIPIDPTLIVNGLRGLTAFGSLPEFESGGMPTDAVVLIDGTEDLLQVVRGLIAGLQLEKPEMLTTLQVGDHVLYQLTGETLAGTFLSPSQMAIGKSLGALESYMEVREGRSDHLALNERFPSFKPGASSGFFLGAVVEGLNGFDNLPAQARILQLSRAASVQLGEVGENLVLEAGLKTDDLQTATQVRDVLQGLIALTLMTQTGQPDLAALIRSARVSLENTSVTLELAYPVNATLGWIEKLAAMAGEAMQPDEEEAGSATGETVPESTEPASVEEPAE